MRGWKGILLSAKDYEGLLSIPDLDSLMKKLKETPYSQDIEETRTRFKSETPLQLIIQALKNHIVRIHRMLKKGCPESALALLEAVMAPFEVHSIKTVMRGIERNIDPEETFSALAPAWTLDTKALRELMNQKDIRGVISLLDTWGLPYAKPLKSGYEEYSKEKRLSLLEMALDRFVFEFYFDNLNSSDEDSVITRSVLSKRADTSNLLNLSKMTFEGFLPAHPLRYFIRGGMIKEDDFLDMLLVRKASEFLDRIPEILRDKKWIRAIRAEDLTNLQFLETLLNGVIRRYVCRYAVERPLSIAVPICFLYKQYSETERLRIIATGINFMIPQSELRKIMNVYR